jgi:hypothetical protein
MDLTYDVIIGGQCIEVAAEDARIAWDESPEDLRRGRREGAFILWGEDELGRRVAPIVFRPKRTGDSKRESAPRVQR